MRYTFGINECLRELPAIRIKEGLASRILNFAALISTLSGSYVKVVLKWGDFVSLRITLGAIPCEILKLSLPVAYLLAKSEFQGCPLLTVEFVPTKKTKFSFFGSLVRLFTNSGRRHVLN